MLFSSSAYAGIATVAVQLCALLGEVAAADAVAAKSATYDYVGMLFYHHFMAQF
jgi:hypothetical protein